MRLLLIAMILTGSANLQAQTPESVQTPDEARAFAAENLWAEVQVLPASECTWIVRTGSNDSEAEPAVGDVGVMRNTRYQLIADTTVTFIQCAIVDFSLEEMTEEEADSSIAVMMTAYRRIGDFKQVVDQYLPAEQRYRYVMFNETSSRMEEILGDNLESYSDGQVIVVQDSEGQPYKFIVYILAKPEVKPAFIVLKTRMDQ